MAITVKDLFQYDSNFDVVKIRRLTGKTNFKKTDVVDLTQLAALNDKDLSIFVAKKEGQSFLNSITDNNIKMQVADASGIKNQKDAIPKDIPMDKSVFDIEKPELA